MSASTFAVVTGGGTAGHVLPALAIADALVASGHRTDEIVYVGAQRGVETRLVPATPYAHHFLAISGLQRRVTPSNVVLPFTVWRAVVTARRLLRSLRPAVVISVGGYASVPATLAARLLRIPVVVVSYDRHPGLASRLSSRIAAACAVAFEGSTLPRAHWTGAPVRRELVEMDRPRSRHAARERLGLPPDRFVVAAFGGSLGSELLNEAVRAMVVQLSGRSDLAVRHVVGERFLSGALSPGALPRATVEAEQPGIMYDVIGYEDRMVDVYAAADLMITRAGASTIAELATVGMPSIIVPWAGAAADHQSENGRVLGGCGAAIVMSEDDVRGPGLASSVLALIDDPAALAEMATQAFAAGEAHRSGRLVDLIERVADGR